MSRADRLHRLGSTTDPARRSRSGSRTRRRGIAVVLVLATSCSSDIGTESASTSTAAKNGLTTTTDRGSTPPESAAPTTSPESATGGTVISPATGKCTAAPSDEPLATPLPISVKVGGTTRNALIRLPAGSAADTQHPVVFNFHGAGATPNEQYRYGNLNAGADVAGAILVLPKSASTAWQPQRGDLEFVDALLGEVKSRFCVDPSRIYAAGMSSGALMTSWLACTRSDVFAAFATVATAVYSERRCAGAGPIDLVGFHGTADPLVPFGSGSGIDGVPTGGGVAGQYAAWARHDGCDPTPRQTDISAEVVQRMWTGCSAGGSITLCAVRDGGHTWPGAIPVPRMGMTTNDIDAADPIWALFDAHRLGD